MTGSYTIGAICAPAAVAGLELTVLRTGILRRGRFWVTIAITLGFQVAVDGWLTKLPAPIVAYRRAAISGMRWPWDIPVEDFGFGIAMITLTLALWERALRRHQRADPEPLRPAGADRGAAPVGDDEDRFRNGPGFTSPGTGSPGTGRDVTDLRRLPGAGPRPPPGPAAGKAPDGIPARRPAG